MLRTQRPCPSELLEGTTAQHAFHLRQQVSERRSTQPLDREHETGSHAVKGVHDSYVLRDVQDQSAKSRPSFTNLESGQEFSSFGCQSTYFRIRRIC